MKVKNSYGNEDLVKTEYYCPNCAEQNVYVENNEGDYYLGSTHYCLSCKYRFSISGSVDERLEFEE